MPPLGHGVSSTNPIVIIGAFVFTKKGLKLSVDEMLDHNKVFLTSALPQMLETSDGVIR